MGVDVDAVVDRDGDGDDGAATGRRIGGFVIASSKLSPLNVAVAVKDHAHVNVDDVRR
jgi:hypothetical protein